MCQINVSWGVLSSPECMANPSSRNAFLQFIFDFIVFLGFSGCVIVISSVCIPNCAHVLCRGGLTTLLHLRYVGVLLFVSHVLQLLQIRITHWHLFCHEQMYDEAATQTGLNIEPLLITLWLSKVHVRWNPDLNAQILPIVFTVKWVVNKIWRHSPISSKHVPFWWLFFSPPVTTQQSNIGVRLRKATE